VPYISKSSIQEVTDRLDANAVVSDYIHLEKRGGRLWACCPFHNEKTASFTVNPDLKTYYCFGCHKGGTMINFIMEMDKLSFPEAVELLAKKAGVELVYENSANGNFSAEEEEKKKKKEELFELYRRISGTFHHFLLKNFEARPAWDYIISRGINSEMIERFGLGYSPSDRYWLGTFLSEKGYSKEFLAASGLFSSRSYGSSDTLSSIFSGRIIFPIKDQQGRNVAFGGRFLPGQVFQREGWEPPKYINSPESVIYKKGETLYALDAAMPEIRRTKTAYIAEGYLDVIALHQAGVTNALAPLGTAFTDAQVKLLQRWVEKVIFFFDSDEAGRAAANKGIYTCRRNGLSCAVVSPEAAVAKDPADLLKDFGSEALQKAAKSIISDLDFLLARARDLYGNSGSEGKAKGVAFIFPYIELLDSEVARTACIEAAADAFALLPAVIAGDFSRFASGQKTAVAKEASNLATMEKTNPPIRVNDEILLLIVVALDYVSFSNNERKETLFSRFRFSLDINDFEDPNAKEIYVALEECFRYGENSMDELLARVSSPELKKILLERGVSGEFSINAEQFVNDGIKKIKRKDLEHRQEEIIIKLRSLKKNTAGEGNSKEALALQASDDVRELEATDEVADEIRELLAEKMQVDDELNQMKQGRLSCLN
jgi:DNA primase